MKVTLNGVGSLIDATTAQTTINGNNQIIENAFNNTLSLDGTQPNAMQSTFDMNSNQVINLPFPATNNSPARLIDIGNAPASAAAAAASATAAAGSATAASGSATAASGSATAAAASAVTAQGYITGLSGTSTTSVTIGTGSKSFTATTGKLWVAGNFVTVSSNANSANYMHGSVTSYNSTTGALVVNVLDIGGAGTLTDWNINITGTQGPQGPTGPSGAVGVTGTPTVNQFATWNNATTVQGVSLTGLVKGNGASAPTAAVSNTDYLPVASPVMTTPSLGVASATTVNKVTLTPPATGSTLTVVDGKTLTASNTVTLAGTDSSTLNYGVGGTLTGSSSAAVFYDNIPQNSQSVAYTLVLADANKHVFHPAADTTARIWTIPANASVAYPVGTAITFINQNAGGVITISITTDTLRLAGVGTTGSRTLAANGIATAIKITATEWIISGTGLT